MTAGAPKRVFAARPGDAERWIKAPEPLSGRRPAAGEEQRGQPHQHVEDGRQCQRPRKPELRHQKKS